MRLVSLLLLGALSACAAQPQVAPKPATAPPAQARFQASPASSATDTEVSDFFSTCSSAHLDASIGSKGLTGQHDETQMRAASYYIKVANAYSSKEHTDQKWTELRNAATARFEREMAGTNVFGGIANVLREVQVQLVECSNYKDKNKVAIEARVAQSGTTK